MRRSSLFSFSTLWMTLGLALTALPCPAALRLGVCAGVESAAVLKEAGFDYLELSLSGVAKLSESEYSILLKQVEQAPIKPEAMNGFLPGHLKVVGPEADLAKLRAYTEAALQRAHRLGVRVVVFGSGGARRIPDGGSKEEAEKQVIQFLRMVSEVAARYPDMVIVIEPLRPEETNLINTVAEGVGIAKRVDRPNIRGLADLYHMGSQKESMQAVLEEGKSWIRHAHIARIEGRVYPKPGDSSTDLYKQFFAALHRVGYSGRISVEAKAENGLKIDAPETAAWLRKLAAEAR